MPNLFSLKNLSTEEVNTIVDLALKYKRDFKNDKTLPSTSRRRVIANLFFEPSTRTHYSFQVAQSRLNCDSLNFIAENSSLKKGETFKDTIRTFDSYDLDALVIRSKENEYWKHLDGINTPIINAGDGSGNHPTQSLLDLVTIKERFGSFEGKKILIVGDIAHSRVANTNIEIMRRLGMKVYCSAPESMRKPGIDWVNLDDFIDQVDVIMLLRIQFERHEDELGVKPTEYNNLYGLNEQRESKMKPNSIIMHPAPFNRGFELDDYIADVSIKNKIFEQSGNGVWSRMAIIQWITGGK